MNDKINKHMNAPEQERKRKKTTNNKDHLETPKASASKELDTKERMKKLNPPKNNEDSEIENRDVYEIYISKFDIATEEKEIGAHIMDKTRIKTTDLFKVSKLKSRTNDATKNYVSFKVTTLRGDVYKQIINQKIWEPDFMARDFKQSFTKTERNDQYKVRFKPYTNERSNYNNITPRRYNRNGEDMRKRAINNNIRMENHKRTSAINNQNINSPMRTPRGAQTRTNRSYHKNGFHSVMGMNQPVPWANPQVMIYPTNQRPNFFIPFHQPNPIIAQQNQQHTTQNTQENQT